MNPLRMYIPIALVAVFLLWILYRLFFKKDLKQNLPNVLAGCLFIFVWAAIFFWLK